MENYEDLKQSPILPQEAKEAWILADQASGLLTQRYEKLISNESLNNSFRSSRAQELYEDQKGKIEAKKKKAREMLLKHARFAEQSSIPRPAGEGLTTKDSSKLLADQNEASRLIRTIERR